MKIQWVSQNGMYKFPLPAGKCAYIFTASSIYYCYSSSTDMATTILSTNSATENITYAFDKPNKIVSVYRLGDASGFVQCVLLIPA